MTFVIPETVFADGFDSEVYPGETITAEHDGFTFTATVHRDDDMGPPWQEHDGHGEVTGWVQREKGPGELLLNEDGGSRRFYDFAGACRIARRDGWGAKGDEGMTPRQRAAHAARADFEYLRAWCADEWCWVGVAVTVSRDGVDLVDDYAAALWGIDSTSGDHITATANELAGQAFDLARAKLAKLCACAA